jgi:hypothetical protein
LLLQLQAVSRDQRGLARRSSATDDNRVDKSPPSAPVAADQPQLDADLLDRVFELIGNQWDADGVT